MKEQLIINTSTRTCDERVFATRKHAVKGRSSIVKCSPRGGFTLVEMIVALGLFTIVMFIATSAFLAIVSSDRKSRSVRIAADNLNIALEDMSRRIKTGTSYYCGINGEAPLLTNDCLPPGTSSDTIFFTDQDDKRVSYKKIGTAIWRSVGFDAAIQVTSPEIQIDTLKFFVVGSSPSPANKVQPLVVIAIKGSLGQGTASSTFTMQTSVTQRAYDN